MKKYLKHFSVLFIVTAVLLVIFIGVKVATQKPQTEYTRTNDQCKQTERVFDYADVLTDEEENSLRRLIAEREDEIGCDIVLVTIDDPFVSSDPAMMNYADDFYDDNMYGYDEPWGDGALYLDNWANGYCWFSTCGRVETEYSIQEINHLIDYVCEVINDDPYEGYKRYVESLTATMSGREVNATIPMSFILIIAAVVTLIYVIVGVAYNKGKKTTTASTYVAGGLPDFQDRRDVFLTKHTTRRHIDRSGGSGGGGGGGHHVSSGGHSHGGGGGRH